MTFPSLNLKLGVTSTSHGNVEHTYTNTDVQIFVEQKYTNADAVETSVMKHIDLFMRDCCYF